MSKRAVGRLAMRQILTVPRYINEMLVVKNQDQLTPMDPRSSAKYGSPFEMNLAGWYRSELKPSIRELIEGPVSNQPIEGEQSRFGRVKTPRRIDLRRARRRAKFFTHINSMTGGLFSNWKQVSKSVGVYQDFLKNRMEYELESAVQCPVPEDFTANNELHRRAIQKFRVKTLAKIESSLEASKGSEFSRLLKADRRLRCMIEETKIISKRRFIQINSILSKYPIL